MPEESPATAPTTKPKRGGPRPGSGRPPGAKDMIPRKPTRTMRSFQEEFNAGLATNQSKVIAALFRNACAGDSKILIELTNRVLGRVPDRVELSGPGGAPIRLQALASVALSQLSSSELAALDALQSRLQLPAATQVIDIIPSPDIDINPDDATS